jgi:hypothetical protein
MSFPWEDDWGGVAVESDVPWEDTFKEEPPEPPLVLGQPEAPVAEVDSMRPVMAGEPVDLGPQRQLEPVQAPDAFPRLSPSELGMARAGIGAFERPKTLGEAVGRGLTSSPLSVVPPVEIPPESSFSKAAVLELANVAKSVPEFFTSAAGIATLFGAKIAPRLVSAGFSADMLLAGLKQAKQAYENWDQMTDAEKGVAVVDTTSALLFSGMAGAHAAGVKLKPAAKPEFQGPIATGEVLPMPRPAVPVRMPIQLPDAARVEPPPGVVVEAQPKQAPAVESSVRLVGTKSTAPWPYALVSKDPTGQGWRLTWFSEFEGKKAPQGHKDFPTREAALSEAKDLDFEEAPPAARPVEALPATAEAPPSPKPAEHAAPTPPRDWELFYENLTDDLDSFAPARHTGIKTYDLNDVAQRFVDYAKADQSGKPLDKLIADFAKSDEASAGQIKKLRQSVKSVLESEQHPPPPPAPKIAEEKPTQAKEPWEMTRSEYGSEANRKALESPNLPPKPPSSYEVLDALEKRNNRKPYNPDLLTDESLGKLGDDGLISGSPKRAKFTEEGRARLYEWRRISEDRRLAEGDLADKAVDDALDKHKASVEKAIREGKPVPPEVLKDYPDLAPPPGTAVPKPVELSEPTPAPKPAESAKPEDVGETMEQRAAKADPFERARSGESSAFDELDEQFRNIWEDTSDIEFGRPNPNQVHTPKQFADRFNAAFAARDFDTILETIKATSDVSVWKPFLKDLFARQAKDPIAAEKADWMRHVFNGTRPPNAAAPKPPPRPHAAPPPVTPTPRPRPGAPPPPPPPPPQPPAPPPVRIPVDPIPGGGAKSPYKILEDFSAAIKKEIRVLRMKRNVLGVYKPGSTTTSERFAGDLDTAAHELAGHWTDDRYGIGKPWIAPRTRSPYDAELAKFWIHGSVKPSSSLRYRRAEGIAEFIRAYVVNPKQAKSDAPNFTAYFERTLPTEALKAINDFGTDVRRWAGEDPLVRAGLNIRMEPPTLTARLWKGLMGRGFGFEISPIDRLRLWFDDPYHFAVKADKAIRAVRGGRDLPSEQFELTARLLSTHDARMSDQFERGLVPLRPGQKPNAKGQLEVERSIDPVTNEPMTLKWLMGSFDTSSRDAFMKDMKDVSAFMVAQRTIEKAKILGKDRVSGIGAGIMSDVTAAKELLAKVSADPALKAKLEEGARRYRMWADHNLQMLVDGGRITAGQKRRIQAENQQYVDMHRLSSEFDVANFARRGGHIGTPSDVIKRFRGSTLELDNVYSNLLEQTDSIQKEAHRNVVMNNFTDGLRNTRNLHGPELKDFDQFGRKVTSADRNTITVYKNGKAEHWQFAPEIFESLKGLGDLQTNALWSLAMLPSRFARYMITRGPSFMIRNPLRDTFERAVNSRSSGKPWDILQGYSQRELSRYEVFGGGQFGNYIVDAHVWNREIKKVMREMVKDPRNILLSPLRLKDAWSALGEKSEKLGRVAEFRRAFDLGRKKLAADHPTMTPKELDYNAALYAAGEARALLDFAKAGTVMKYVNQAIPFSNAGVRGLAKSIHGMKTDPAGYAMRWAVHVLLPTLLVMLWNRRDDTTWKEYLQLPAYRRDFFWNLKAGDYWLTLPKPHLLGVLAGGVERIISSLLGDPNSGFGFASSLENTMPVSNIAESSGPLKTFLELNMNRDTFRSRDIVPPWEKDLDLDLRKGAKFASGAGQGAAGALNVIGLGIDPRQIDHVLRSMGGWGNIAMAVTARNRNLVDVGLQSTGLITQRPGANAEDVVRVMDWARQHGKTSSKDFQKVIQLRKQFFEATTPEAKEKARVALVNEAGRLRRKIDNALQK